MSKKKNKGSRSWIVAISAISIVILIIVVIVSTSGVNRQSYQPIAKVHTNTPRTYSINLFSPGQVFSLNAGQSKFLNFTIPQGAYSINVTGSYTSQGKIEVAILTPTQYGAFTQNPSSISSSQYYYGDTHGSTINAQLLPGQYILIFHDPGIFTQDTITIVNPIIAHYTN